MRAHWRVAMAKALRLLCTLGDQRISEAVAWIVRAQDLTTAYSAAETSTSFDGESSEPTTKAEEESTTLSDEAVYRSGVTEAADAGTQATTADEHSTTESTTNEVTYSTPGEEPVTSTPEDEAILKKGHVPDVAETSTAVVPERKPVKEPPFIKKYWPLLCLAAKCDKRGSAPTPVIPSPDAPEVRSDLEESRSADSGESEVEDSSEEDLKPSGDLRTSAEILKALEEQMLGDQADTDSTQTTDKSTEVTRFSSDESSDEKSTIKPETTTSKSWDEDDDKDDKEDDGEDDDDDDVDDDDEKKKEDD